MSKSDWECLDDASKNIKDELWSFYWREWKSGTEEFEEFLHKPLRELKHLGAKKGFKVHTNILNHEVGLTMSAVCSLAIVDPKGKVVYVTMFKH